MDVFIAIVLFGGLIVLANVLEKRDRERERQLFTVLLLLLNVPVLVLGLIISTAQFQRLATDLDLNISNGPGFGAVLILMAVWGMVACLKPVRKLLARVTAIDPDSVVHTLALMLAGYFLGQGSLTLSQGGLEGLAENVQPTSIALVAASELMFAVMGLLGVGFLVRRRGRALFQRLGLERPQLLHWFIGLGWIGVLVVAQIFVGLGTMLLNPAQSELLESVNTLWLADFDTVWEWLILAIAAGLGEELLFRGALQPIFGLGATSVLFALIHIQYGLSLFTVFIVIVAVVLGLIRRYYSTTIAIFVHVGYNFVLGLMALLAMYLEQFVT